MKLKHIAAICLFDWAVHDFEAIGFSIMFVIGWSVYRVMERIHGNVEM